MIYVGEWWLISSVFGVAALPIAWRVFSRLPDRGVGFARTIGILAVGTTLWLGASVKWLPNSVGGVILSFLIVTAIGLFAGRHHWRELREWMRSNRRTLLTMEALYLVAFVFWSLVRASNPEISGTEKPMELAFINAILNSSSFPPNDPWLSGHAISYYYFGYVLIAVLTRLSAVPAGVAFNLTSSMWFALSLLGAYSVLYNLIHHASSNRRLGAPFLAPIFVFITGNLEGLLEVFHARHFFWRNTAEGTLSSMYANGFDFWGWLGIKNLTQAPIADPSWIPGRHWWWWRASRVVNDINLAEQEVEVIDEFPFFSFLLADNHPHVLALPLILMAITFSLQVILGPGKDPVRLSSMKIGERMLRLTKLLALTSFIGYMVYIGASTAGQDVPTGTLLLTLFRNGLLGLLILAVGSIFLSVLTGRRRSLLTHIEFWFGAWCFGSLLFLNTWDFPIYLFILIAALVWSVREQNPIDIARSVGTTVAALATAGVLMYLPWYPSFSSQAGGILPNLIFPTKFRQFFVMFAPILIPIAAWLLYKLLRHGMRKEIAPFLWFALGVPLLLLLLSWMLSGMIAYILPMQDPIALNDALRSLGVDSVQTAWKEMLSLRARYPWTALSLGALFAGAMVVLLRFRDPNSQNSSSPSSVDAFVLVLIGTGSLLVLGPEFLYLRDQFGTRMNTIFKFYFAAWILWGLAASYAVQTLFELPGRSWTLLKVVLILPLIAGLVYPILGTWTKTQGFQPVAGLTLDGTSYLAASNPSDYAALTWLRENLPRGTIVEAVGGSYSYYGRMSTHTGFPTVLGWPGHESQWRGGARAQGSRAEDIRNLYQTRSWNDAALIIDKYHIDYVVFGDLERSAYRPAYEQKFEVFMDTVYRQADVSVYARRGEVQP